MAEPSAGPSGATHRSFRTRFAVVLALMTGAILLVVGAALLAIRTGDQRDMLQKHADSFAETTNAKLCEAWKLYYGSGSYKFLEIVRQVMKLNEDLHRILILSVSGEVLFDSLESPDLTLLPSRPKRALEDPVLAGRAAQPEKWVERLDAPGSGPLLLIGVPYFEEWGRHPYSVLYVFTYDKMKERIRGNLFPAVGLMLAALAGAGGFSYLLAGRIARPIVQLTQDVRSFTGGTGPAIRPTGTDDEIEELATTFNDMATRLQQQVVKLESANRELATLDRMKTDLLANVSHELRTPLAAIRGYVELISEGQLGEVSETQRKGLDVCLRNAERLTKTINMLLDFSRMELGRVVIRPAPFQIGRLVAQIVGGLEKDAGRRRIRLSNLVEPGLKPVSADRDRLAQVLENLVTNAVKFTPDGGEVSVAARPVEGGRRVEIAVADNGIGIPDDEKARIFDKFYQSDATATRRYGGIGLGLSIVKSILDAHQSEITVTDRPGGGAVFRFSLATAEVKTESGVFHGVLPAASDGDVLAIDDDDDFLSLLRDALTREGFAVRTARTAAEGLAAAADRAPRLFILDVRLPDRDGLDLIQSLRETPAFAAVPILVVSVVDERVEALGLGAVDYLVKPVDRARLVEAAARVLRRDGFTRGLPIT